MITKYFESKESLEKILVDYKEIFDHGKNRASTSVCIPPKKRLAS